MRPIPALAAAAAAGTRIATAGARSALATGWADPHALHALGQRRQRRIAFGASKVGPYAATAKPQPVEDVHCVDGGGHIAVVGKGEASRLARGVAQQAHSKGRTKLHKQLPQQLLCDRVWQATNEDARVGCGGVGDSRSRARTLLVVVVARAASLELADKERGRHHSTASTSATWRACGGRVSNSKRSKGCSIRACGRSQVAGSRTNLGSATSLAGASRTRVNMSHSGPFRCMCGQIHADQFDGPSNDLLPYIDLTSVTALNAVGDGAEAARRIFKPFDQRFERDPCLESEEDDPQLIIRVPFTSPVQIRAFTLIGGGDGQAPRTARFFLNHESLDFSDAEDGRPVQAWDLVEDPIGAVEYPTQFSKFQNVSVLWIFVPDNHGADHTSLSYL